MKKCVCGILLLVYSMSCDARDHKKNDYVVKTFKKQKPLKSHGTYRPAVIASSHQEKSEHDFSALKRRYPRNYNLKYNVNRVEYDDFGYTPWSIRNKQL